MTTLANIPLADSYQRAPTFTKIRHVPLGCSAPPCDWCGATSFWLAYDVGQLMGASCPRCYGNLRHSVAMSEGGCDRR